jgi:hypothetical protein
MVNHFALNSFIFYYIMSLNNKLAPLKLVKISYNFYNYILYKNLIYYDCQNYWDISRKESKKYQIDTVYLFFQSNLTSIPSFHYVSNTYPLVLVAVPFPFGNPFLKRPLYATVLSAL